MTGESRVTMHKGAAALFGVALVLAGAGASYLTTPRGAGRHEPMSTRPAGDLTAGPASGHRPPATAIPASTGPLPDLVVALTTDAVERAGIVTAPVVAGRSGGDIRLPGVVEPNAYKRVVVTPLVAGRVTRVSAELGATVRRGQTIAQIYSPELAHAETQYIGASAMLDAHDRELKRTRKLAEIGAASRQELERIHAEHAAQTAAVQSARSQLELLGVPASGIDALESGGTVTAVTSVPAPISGVVTERAANVGLNVNQATALFTVVDLSTVWIVADLYEKDFSRVRIGSRASISTPAYPGRSLHGRVSYIDPQVNAETRTARIRVEVSNPRGDLRLGMYADVVVTGSQGASVPVVPRNAVQRVGGRTVVYLVNPKEPGRFIEREVHVGRASGEQVEVVSGVQAGDLVVTEGSFFVRAERERLGLRPVTAPAHANAGAASAEDPTAGSVDEPQTATVVIDEQGFHPAKLRVSAGRPVHLTFLRTTDNTCGTEVVLPSLNIRRALPLNEPVQVEFTPAGTGETPFACGMGMLRGTVVVE